MAHDSASITDAIRAHGKMQADFFSQVGRCVTEFQRVEDSLPGLFLAAFGTEHHETLQAKAVAVFALIRSLDAKIEAITAVMIDAAPEHQDYWKGLSKRVKLASDTRARIAHSIARMNFYDQPAAADGTYRPTAVAMELHKVSGSGKGTPWTTATLSKEHSKLSKLFMNVVGLEGLLRGMEVPEDFFGG